MKLFSVWLLFCLSALSVFAQEKPKHFDTLYYSSGMIRPCTIVRLDHPNIHFKTTNSKGKEVISNVSVNKLNYYVDYDETGNLCLNPQQIPNQVETGIKSEIEYVFDTVYVAKHHFSINPFSPFMLGLNASYMYRFGYENRMAMHIPFRLFTWFGEGAFVQTGVGLNYIPFNSEHYSMYAGLSTQFYFLDGKTVIGFPVTIGFMSNLTKKLTLHGYAGVGPFLAHPEINGLPLVGDLHIGIGFKLGEPVLSTNRRKRE